MKKIIIISLALICMLSNMNNGTAQVTGFGTIKGKILDTETKKPISDVIVRIRIVGFDEKNTIATVSDKKGEFRAEMLPKNRVLNVLFEKKGYRNVLKTVVLVQEEKEKDITVTMKQGSSYSDVKYETRTYQIKNRGVREIYELIKPFLSDASGSDRVSVSKALKTITVYTNQEKLAKIEKIIQQYDVPLKQIWVEVLLVRAKGNGGKKVVLPDEIKELASQLKSVFKFTDYEIIGKADGIGLEGSTIQTSVNMTYRNSQPSFQISGGLEINGDIIRLNKFTVDVVAPMHSKISTTVNIPDGSKMILGVYRGGVGDGSLITVVTAKIMN